MQVKINFMEKMCKDFKKNNYNLAVNWKQLLVPLAVYSFLEIRLDSD